MFRRSGIISRISAVERTRQCRELLRRPDRLLDLEEDDAIDGLVDEIEDVVDAADQLVDVLSVERRDEGLVQALDRLVRELVADVLEILDLPRAPAEVVEAVEELDQRFRAGVGVARRLLEQVEEDLILRDHVEHEGGLRDESARRAREGAFFSES
jgi:hypothetical protein